MRKIMLLVMIVLLFCLNVFATTLHVQVVYITDGDTIRIDMGDKERAVRLNCIDAPEMAQNYGVQSKKHLRELLLGKFVKIKTHGQDRYGRLIGTVYYRGKDINLIQVKDGSAWVYDKYCDNSEYYKAEKNAKKNNDGLWGSDDPVAPWKFRR